MEALKQCEEEGKKRLTFERLDPTEFYTTKTVAKRPKTVNSRPDFVMMRLRLSLFRARESMKVYLPRLRHWRSKSRLNTLILLLYFWQLVPGTRKMTLQKRSLPHWKKGYAARFISPSLRLISHFWLVLLELPLRSVEKSAKWMTKLILPLSNRSTDKEGHLTYLVRVTSFPFGCMSTRIAGAIRLAPSPPPAILNYGRCQSQKERATFPLGTLCGLCTATAKSCYLRLLLNAVRMARCCGKMQRNWECFYGSNQRRLR